MLIDSHCHLPLIDKHPGGVGRVLARARAAGIAYMLCVGVDLETLGPVLAVAAENADCFASVGVHPNHRAGEEPTVARLLGLAKAERVVAIGETGLDYFRSPGDKKASGKQGGDKKASGQGDSAKDVAQGQGDSARDGAQGQGGSQIGDRADGGDGGDGPGGLGWQHERFRTHIRAAREAGLPLIVHCREAAADVLRILAEERAGEVGGVMHCFVEDWEVGARALDLGFYLSFSGIVTFPTATKLQDVARRMPLERMLVETDAPWLAPAPLRGQTNEPANVRLTAEYIAGLRGVPLAEIAAATSRNFFALFPRAAALAAPAPAA